MNENELKNSFDPKNFSQRELIMLEQFETILQRFYHLYSHQNDNCSFAFFVFKNKLMLETWSVESIKQ